MHPSGRLFVVATPIGNLSDLSGRAAESLRTASLVAAEDTRRTRKLLTHLGLSKPLLRCDEAAEERATRTILETLERGEDVALATDAGTPSVADPGARLIDAVHRSGGTVVPIPGPSAITTALSVSGFRASPFRFFGFLSKKETARRRELEQMAASEDTSAFFEAPYRLLRTMSELAEVAPERMVFVARELTKQHEELIRGTARDVAARLTGRKILGEATVVVGPSKIKEIEIE
ncbi:MAG: 16S rRNA (cytidine(1402)-2'-O)-methyltransferase [Pseudomonadota bacterium]